MIAGLPEELLSEISAIAEECGGRLVYVGDGSDMPELTEDSIVLELTPIEAETAAVAV
ncbi:hypothetical protein Pan44_16170 [Caulifigura coniformis]|uniref:Uncharacterized protein n=1 Tax=Caulifigura coniformis TaxID=2527983 RepID=A0A517SBV4_9PLAN|nr:hypothetical protein [Caulifigura coniformis]QDT53595.1 hypothetical protein Pan44_16170 [Caulifigura coniformis]